MMRKFLLATAPPETPQRREAQHYNHSIAAPRELQGVRWFGMVEFRPCLRGIPPWAAAQFESATSRNGQEMLGEEPSYDRMNNRKANRHAS
jgi:hypothetical protein